jgi:DNA-binding MarR family transcriptional regulator
MQTRSLLHTLFPLVRAEVLRLLFMNAGQELYGRELARLSFLAAHTVQDELAKLEAADLIVSRSNGYQRFFRANLKHPLYTTLRRLVIKGSAQSEPQAPARRTTRRRRPRS